jgi:hypothetical protein
LAESAKALDISNAVISKIADVPWTGKQLRPKFSVSYNGKPLLGYLVSYGTNKTIGKGTVTIIGDGVNSTGTKSVSFNIVPMKIAISKLVVGKKQVAAKWKASPKAQKITKYEIRYALKGKNKWTVKAVSAKKASLVIKKLKKGKQYQFQIRAYKTVGGTKYYSAWSATKTSKKVK